MMLPVDQLKGRLVHQVRRTMILPSQHESYKEAYYDPITVSFLDSTEGGERLLACAALGVTANAANCNQAVGDLTDVVIDLNSARAIGRGGSFKYHAGFTSGRRIFQNDPRLEVGG